MQQGQQAEALPASHMALAVVGFTLLLVAVSMIGYTCITIHNVLTAPDKVPLITTLMTYMGSAKPALYGAMNGQVVDLRLSPEIKSIAFLTITIMGLSALIGACSAIISAAVLVLRLAFNQKLYGEGKRKLHSEAKPVRPSAPGGGSG